MLRSPLKSDIGHRTSNLDHEPLAQSVEHLTFNQGVVGSSPTWLTIPSLLWDFPIKYAGVTQW